MGRQASLADVDADEIIALISNYAKFLYFDQTKLSAKIIRLHARSFVNYELVNASIPFDCAVVGRGREAPNSMLDVSSICIDAHNAAVISRDEILSKASSGSIAHNGGLEAFLTKPGVECLQRHLNAAPLARGGASRLSVLQGNVRHGVVRKSMMNIAPEHLLLDP